MYGRSGAGPAPLRPQGIWAFTFRCREESPNDWCNCHTPFVIIHELPILAPSAVAPLPCICQHAPIRLLLAARALQVSHTPHAQHTSGSAPWPGHPHAPENTPQAAVPAIALRLHHAAPLPHIVTMSCTASASWQWPACDYCWCPLTPYWCPSR